MLVKDNLQPWSSWKKKYYHGKRQAESFIENEAKVQLRNAYNYIKKDSPQNAEKIKSDILASFQELINNPESHAPDKYRITNDGSYRAYEIYKYRITYHLSEERIIVIRIRHTKMNPLKY
jgi:plasmid stabilization system protein ParE